MNSEVNWLINWFVCEGAVKENIVKNLDTNYFTAGYIDSFQFVKMIADAEDEFGIEFDNEHFENSEYLTINGLAHIIKSLRKT